MEGMTDPVVEAATAARQKAYAPYSDFRVGAAVEADDGRVYAGANVESASYGVTMCAERVALGAAITGGVRRFRRIVIVTDAAPPAAPCGMCRQALSEFGVDLQVDAIGNGERRSWQLRDLLPDRFGPEDLKA
jgi:cytidine deaminase